jgi:hypothetical protein
VVIPTVAVVGAAFGLYRYRSLSKKRKLELVPMHTGDDALPELRSRNMPSSKAPVLIIPAAADGSDPGPDDPDTHSSAVGQEPLSADSEDDRLFTETGQRRGIYAVIEAANPVTPLADELILRVGENVHVSDISHDLEWCIGFSLDTLKSGRFPFRCVAYEPKHPWNQDNLAPVKKLRAAIDAKTTFSTGLVQLAKSKAENITSAETVAMTSDEHSRTVVTAAATQNSETAPESSFEPLSVPTMEEPVVEPVAEQALAQAEPAKASQTVEPMSGETGEVVKRRERKTMATPLQALMSRISDVPTEYIPDVDVDGEPDKHLEDLPKPFIPEIQEGDEPRDDRQDPAVGDPSSTEEDMDEPQNEAHPEP